jgi:mycothiol synthase
MHISTRPYDAHVDFPHVREFFIAMGADAQHNGIWHLGNLVIGLYFEPPAIHDIQLWHEPSGILIGLGWYDIASGWLGMQLHPQWRKIPQLKHHILTWGEAQARRHRVSTPVEQLQVVALAQDAAYITWLEAHGFVREPFTLLRMRQTLAYPLTAADLPPGWAMQIERADQVVSRAVVYRDVWGQHEVQLADYQRMRDALDYRAELDLVVVAPDGSYAAFCLCWFDPANHTGLIEPMGTVPRFRRSRCGRAVLTEGLRRLRALGAREVFVTVDAGAEGARQLYETSGFQTVMIEYHYHKVLGSGRREEAS